MEAILSGIGSAAGTAMPSAVASPFGLSPDMIKSLGSGGNGAKGAEAMLQQLMADDPKQGQTPQMPRAQPRQVSIEDIMALLKNRSTLGT